MAADRPIVATRITSHTQVLDDSSAFLGAPTVEALAEALQRALDTSAEGERTRRALAEAALGRIKKKYNRDEFGRRLLEMYESILGKPDAASLERKHEPVVTQSEGETRADQLSKKSIGA